MTDVPERRARAHEIAGQMRRAGFPQWLMRVELSDVWRNEDMTFTGRRDAIVARIRRSPWYASRIQAAADGRPDVLEMFVEELGDADSADAFNTAWEQIYGIADGDRVWLDVHGTRGDID